MPRPILAVLGLPLGFALTLIGTCPVSAQDPPALPPGVDVQARGPVHEAFAQPANPQPTQGPIISKQPPDPIQELPPDQKPDGDNVQWIPGYWAWDEDSSGFMWVSGCWRVPPPGMRWVSGHWQEVQGGWLWVSGFWTPDGTTQVNYIPPPPPSLEQGPTTTAPNGSSTYIPGTWVYVNAKYLWRPGHWTPFRAGWVWVPACYIWTPAGCLFIDGYWDLPLDQRGFLFSPVLFNLGLWQGYGRPWVPQYLIQPDFLLGALFVRLANYHFYFGDYFEPLYGTRGFVAWPDYHPLSRLFDPNFAYYQHLHMGDSKWEPALRQLYAGRRGGEIPRPPRTLALQTQMLGALGGRGGAVVTNGLYLTHFQNATVLTSLNRINTVRVTNLAGIAGERGVAVHEMKALAVTKEEHEREAKAVAQMRAVSIERRDIENKMLHTGGIPVKHTDPARPVRLEVPKPPPHVVERPVVKEVPRRIEPPAHEERPIPKYEPARPPEPRREKR